VRLKASGDILGHTGNFGECNRESGIVSRESERQPIRSATRLTTYDSRLTAKIP
jgi:hypothetical protein